MIKHCDNCSKCCEVIAINGLSPKDLAEGLVNGRFDPSYEMLIPLTRDEALERNDHYVRRAELYDYHPGYYTCRHLDNGRCGNYENRPVMCSGYPFYGKWAGEDVQSHSWLAKTQLQRHEVTYSPTCTYVPEIIKVRNVDNANYHNDKIKES